MEIYVFLHPRLFQNKTTVGPDKISEKYFQVYKQAPETFPLNFTSKETRVNQLLVIIYNNYDLLFLLSLPILSTILDVMSGKSFGSSV